MLEVTGRRIETVAIVDDDARSRESLMMCVDDSPLESCAINGPLRGDRSDLSTDCI